MKVVHVSHSLTLTISNAVIMMAGKGYLPTYLVHSLNRLVCPLDGNGGLPSGVGGGGSRRDLRHRSRPSRFRHRQALLQSSVSAGCDSIPQQTRILAFVTAYWLWQCCSCSWCLGKHMSKGRSMWFLCWLVISWLVSCVAPSTHHGDPVGCTTLSVGSHGGCLLGCNWL